MRAPNVAVSLPVTLPARESWGGHAVHHIKSGRKKMLRESCLNGSSSPVRIARSSAIQCLLSFVWDLYVILTFRLAVPLRKPAVFVPGGLAITNGRANYSQLSVSLIAPVSPSMVLPISALTTDGALGPL